MSAAARIDEALRRVTLAQWLPQLLVRLFVGYFFLETGWGKIHNLDGMTERFTEWGIPPPKKVGGLDDFVELDEPPDALSFLWLFFSGPGRVSLDRILEKMLRRKHAAELGGQGPT